MSFTTGAEKPRRPEHENNPLYLTLGHIKGNLVNCSLCGKEIQPDEGYFDYDYAGVAEIVHNDCVDKEMARLKKEEMEE